MYIIKNALRCIGRSKGRNVLIGIIVLVISVSACIGLSIRQASDSAKENALAGMSVTATIQYDRASAMGNITGGRPSFGGMPGGGERPEGGFDKDQFANIMGNASSLTLEEYEKYADASTVELFYYTLTAYFNGSDELLPVTDEASEDSTADSDSDSDSSSGMPDFMGGMMGNMMGSMPSLGDFSIVGYSSDAAMTEFINGSASRADGKMMDTSSAELVCVISEELAMYNYLSVGDTITISNPSVEDETYTLTVCGIYTSTANNDFSMSMFGLSQDPANRIYMSAAALQTIIDESVAAESESPIEGEISATYSFANPDDYYVFEEEVRTLGLDESYTVSSSDISSFENSLAPLETLGTMAGWFLLVILVIGGVILVVLNIFNVRERKYEVGVLTAMGMKKWKVAAQFMCEILVVTMIAVIIGAGIGAVSSVPVTNALLKTQVESQSNQQNKLEQNLGRPSDMPSGFPGGGSFGGGSFGGADMEMPSDFPFGGGDGFLEEAVGGAVNYVTEVDSAMNLTVVIEMIGVGLLLTLVASAAAVLFIMRYDPLKILANRD